MQYLLNKIFKKVCMALIISGLSMLFTLPVWADSSAFWRQGGSVAALLSHLNKQGHNIVYSNSHIHPGVKILQRPEADSVLEMLSVVLKPFDLVVVPAPNNRIVIQYRAQKKLFNLTVNAVGHGKSIVTSDTWISIYNESGDLIKNVEGNQLALDKLACGHYQITAESIHHMQERLVIDTTNACEDKTVSIELKANAVEHIEVSTNQYDISYSQSSQEFYMSRDDIEQISHLANDVNRAVVMLPGMAGGNVSAELFIRGGREDENLFLLDGMPLFDPYHVKEAGSYFSIIDSFVIDSVKVITGGATVDYGEHMSGVIELNSNSWDEDSLYGVSINFLNLRGRAGVDSDKSNGFITARKGYLSLLDNVSAVDLENYNPRYYDVFAKYQYDWTDDTKIFWRTLYSEDSNTCISSCAYDGEGRSITQYHWLTMETQWADELASTTLFGFADAIANRNGFEESNVEIAAIDDYLAWRQFVFKQDWLWQFSEINLLKMGLEAKHAISHFDYRLVYNLYDPFKPINKNPGLVNIHRKNRFSGNTYAAYLASIHKISSRFSLELGLRLDHQTHLDSHQISPRLNTEWLMGNNRQTRFSFGRFYKTQQVYEFNYQDNAEYFDKPEYADQFNMTFSEQTDLGIKYQIAVYHKEYKNTAMRYENVLGDETTVYENSFDRTRIDVEASKAYGAEVLVKSTENKSWAWWLSYAYGRAKDKVGNKWITRRWEQKHALSAGLSYNFANQCSINVVARYHSGWRRTPFYLNQSSPADNPDEPFMRFGDIYSQTFGSYFRVDSRVGCQSSIGGAKVHYFAEVINLFDRDNTYGASEVATDYTHQGKANRVELDDGLYVPFVPSIGIKVEF